MQRTCAIDCGMPGSTLSAAKRADLCTLRADQAESRPQTDIRHRESRVGGRETERAGGRERGGGALKKRNKSAQRPVLGPLLPVRRGVCKSGDSGADSLIDYVGVAGRWQRRPGRRRSDTSPAYFAPIMAEGAGSCPNFCTRRDRNSLIQGCVQVQPLFTLHIVSSNQPKG